MTLVFVVLALGYVRGWLGPRSEYAQAVGTWRAAGFLLGLSLIWIAMASPLASADRHLLTAHMVQHLLLMSVAPPLIWLGEPVRILQRALPRLLDDSIAPILQWRLVQRAGWWLGHPVLCWAAGAAALVAWHVPALLTLSMNSNAWHAIEHASFLGGGLLFWWPVIQPWPASPTEPRWSIVLYLFLATLPCDVLSGFLVFSDRIVYPVYSSAHGPSGLDAVDDQQLAGALMWTAVTIVYPVAAVIAAWRALGGVSLPLSGSHTHTALDT
jgi:cytochrome c oxidase assembly factor CtaG